METAQAPTPNPETSPLPEKMGFFARIKKRLDQPMFAVKSGKLSFFSKIGIGEERNYLIDNLSMLLAAGMDVMKALEAIEVEIKSPQMKQVIDQLKQDIQNGEPMWKSLERINLLPDHVISLIRIGEESGRLSENLEVVVIQQQKSRAFRSKVKSAMMYPAILLIVTLIIGIGIAWFILPKLSVVFMQMNLDLPTMTKILVWVGNFLKANGFWSVPTFLVILAYIIYFFFISQKHKHLGQAFLFKIPAIKKLVQESELARLGYILGTLLEAGMPIVAAIDSLQKSTSFRIYQKFYQHLRDKVKIGTSLQESFQSFPSINRMIPSPMQQMIITAGETRQLPKTLLNLGKTYEDKVDTTAKNLSVLIEPLMLLIIWSGVIFIAMAVIVPIYSLVGSVNGPT